MKQKYPMHEIFASCQSVAFQMQSSASVSRSLRTAFAKCASNVLTEMSTTRFYDGDPSNNVLCWDNWKYASKVDRKRLFPNRRGKFRR